MRRPCPKVRPPSSYFALVSEDVRCIASRSDASGVAHRPQAARRAVETVQSHEELLDEQNDEVELLRQRLSETKVRNENSSRERQCKNEQSHCQLVPCGQCAVKLGWSIVAPHTRTASMNDGGAVFTSHGNPQTDVVRLREQLAFARSSHPSAAASLPPLPRPVDTAPRPPTVISLSTYSWEDKQTSVLVWVDVAEETALQEESFDAKLLPESIQATVMGASGKSYCFAQRLYQPIDVDGCKVRTSDARPDSMFPRRRVKQARP